MSQPWFPDPASSRAVLIGVSRFESAELPAIPAVRANLTGLRAALTDPASGTVTPSGCRVLGDDAALADVGRALAEGRKQATDLLLVYYAGHGLLDDDGRLHLALHTTDEEHLGWTAIPIELIKLELGRATARARVLVLDCCFSGLAVEAMAGPAALASGQLRLTGTFTLTSTTANEPSNAPLGAPHTAFTGALLSALASPEPLTLEGIYRHTEDTLTGLGLPRPQCRSVNSARDLALVRGPVPRREQVESTPSPATPRPDPAEPTATPAAPHHKPTATPHREATANLTTSHRETTAPLHPEPTATPATPHREPTTPPARSPQPKPEPAARAAPPPGPRAVTVPPHSTPSASPKSAEASSSFALEPRRTVSAKAALAVAASVAAAVLSWISFTDPFRNAGPSGLEIAMGALFGLFFGVVAVAAAGMVITGVRTNSATWTALEFDRTGIVLLGPGHQRTVPWPQIRRLTITQRMTGPPAVVLILRPGAVLAGVKTRKGRVVLGRCKQWSALSAKARRAAPQSVAVDREDRKLPR